MQDRYQILKEIIDDYLTHMEGINDKRQDVIAKELDFAMEEVKLFGLLQKNVEIVDKMELV